MTKLASIFSLLLALPAIAHHGQDFLVTLDTKTLSPWKTLSGTGFEYSSYQDSEEWSATQTFVLGLPNNFSFATTLLLSDDGSGSWDDFSITPSLQWTAPSWKPKSLGITLNFAIAAGWEIPWDSNSDSNHSHGHGSAPSLQDCSPFIAIPSLYAACQQANTNALNHSHDDDHGHSGIHRHGESHGFIRLIAETDLTEQDRLAANFITVIPEDDSVEFGYAFAYRHQFNDSFFIGMEAIGDLDANGEHLAYLTSTIFINHHLSLTLGAATGLNSQSPDYTLQSLLVWRF